MKQLLILVLCLNTAYSSTGQNHVPNSSFEIAIDELPCNTISNNDNIGNYIANWYSPSKGSSDLLSTLLSVWCDNNPAYDDVQLPRTGNNSAGFIAFASGGSFCADQIGYREYLQILLSQPLLPGQEYCTEFWVSRAVHNNYIYSCDNLAMAFTDTAVIDPESSCIFDFLEPQIVETEIIEDIGEWVPIRGTIVPQDTLWYLTIGNFSPHDSVSSSPPYNPNAYGQGYYFIDDVSIYLSPLADLGPDTFLVSGDSLTLDPGWFEVNTYTWSTGETTQVISVIEPGTYYVTITNPAGCESVDSTVVEIILDVNENQDLETDEVKLYPNPSDGMVHLKSIYGKEYKGFVFNMLGEEVLLVPAFNNHLALGLSGLPTGVYQFLLEEVGGESRKIYFETLVLLDRGR